MLATFKALATPYCPKVLDPVVPKLPRYIVSEFEMVTALDDRFTKEITVPIVYATEEFAGIVYVATPAPEAW